MTETTSSKIQRWLSDPAVLNLTILVRQCLTLSGWDRRTRYRFPGYAEISSS